MPTSRSSGAFDSSGEWNSRRASARSGAAGSLGAQVRAFDVRPEVGEQIESMGAQFVRLEAAQQEVSSDGYASELADTHRTRPHGRPCSVLFLKLRTALRNAGSALASGAPYRAAR